MGESRESLLFLKENQSWTTVKVVKQILFRYYYSIGKKNHSIDLGSIPNTQEKWGLIYSQGAGLMVVVGVQWTENH